MHIKPSGVFLLAGAAIVLVLSGILVARLRYSPDAQAIASPPGDEDVILPENLARKTDQYYPARKGRLALDWSNKVDLATGFGAQIYALDRDAWVEVRCNDSEKYRFVADTQSDFYINGRRLTEKDISTFPPCNFLRVRALNTVGVGKPYLVSMSK